MRFIAFDLETTGFLPGIEQIVEIGALRFIDGEIDAVFSTLVNPHKPIPESASAVNKITDDMVKDMPSIKDLLQPFAEFCKNDILVAHNASFDVQFLSADIKKHESPAPKGQVFDTCAMSKKVLPGLANYKLSTLVQHLKIPSGSFHRAEEDALYCGKLFIELLTKLSPNQDPPLENIIAINGKTTLTFPQIKKQPKQLSFDFL